MGPLLQQYVCPILSVHLVDMGMPEAAAGYGIGLLAASYTVGAMITGCLCKIISRRLVMLFGSLLTAISLILVGPCQIIGVPNEEVIIFIGLGSLGLVTATLIVPLSVEIAAAA